MYGLEGHLCTRDLSLKVLNRYVNLFPKKTVDKSGCSSLVKVEMLD